MNKKGASLSGWTEVALMAALFITLIILLFANMNVKYDENYDGSFGLGNLANSTENSISGYQDTLQQSINTGESGTTSDGISLSTTWNIIKAGINTMWTFSTGGWIEISGGLIGLPVIVGRILRILFILSIGFIIIKLILKIKP
jgi:hypothetical protein